MFLVILMNRSPSNIRSFFTRCFFCSFSHTFTYRTLCDLYTYLSGHSLFLFVVFSSDTSGYNIFPGVIRGILSVSTSCMIGTSDCHFRFVPLFVYRMGIENFGLLCVMFYFLFNDLSIHIRCTLPTLINKVDSISPVWTLYVNLS